MKKKKKAKTKILVEEEYGWKYWLWEIDTVGIICHLYFSRYLLTDEWSEIEAYFKEVVSPEEFLCRNVKKQFLGKWTELVYEEYQTFLNNQFYDGIAHVHMNDDSWIREKEETPSAEGFVL